MSIIRLLPEQFENYNLVSRPQRIFRSSSAGVTGSFFVYQDRSDSLKDISGVSTSRSTADVFSRFSDLHADALESDLQADPAGTLEKINKKKYPGIRYAKKQEVLRTVPGAKLNKTFLKKNTVRKNLIAHYRNLYPSMEWAYTNYHCLNFFEDTKVPSTSALIYPATTGTVSGNFVSHYAPSSSFTFQFYIKPKTNSDTLTNATAHPAGTILHMSSCYAISLVTGSSRDQDGMPDKYRILLQLSQSADISPHDCKLEENSVTAPNVSGDPGFLFATSDNSLKRDCWNHVTIRWPGGSNNGGTGSFVINGIRDSNFGIASSSVMQVTSAGGGIGDPDALFVGNYYSGKNTGLSAISRFFNATAAANEGVTQLNDVASDPVGYGFSSPLRAEIHDLRLYDTFKSDSVLSSSLGEGFRTGSSDLRLYIPPYFVKETRNRNVLQTPFMTNNGSTDDPFNVSLSFGMAGLDLNLENFTREFIRSEYPRHWHMSSSEYTTSVWNSNLEANDVLYLRPAARKKLRSVLPCDNGLFKPDFRYLVSGTNANTKFVDHYGNERLDLITLENMVTDSTLLKDVVVIDDILIRPDEVNSNGEYTAGAKWGNISGENPSAPGFGPRYFLNQVIGASPEDPTLPPGSILSIVHRTGDTSSNEIVMFDISNLFYGDGITPGTVVLEDLMPTGSNGSLSFKLKDNGEGNLYRSDIADGQKAATWSSVGNVFYEEGIVLVKSPNLGLFGKNDFRITFKGDRTVYVFEVTVPVERNLFNSSSNPSYQDLIPTDYSNETSQKFTYLTGINLHDDNLNVVARASLSQPFLKRDEDRVVIKLRMDF